jgi:hypothetical protein
MRKMIVRHRATSIAGIVDRFKWKV